MTGELCYFWIPVADAGRAQAFYGRLFGWEFAPGNIPEGRQITNTTPPGGLHGGEKPSSRQVCFSVDDIHAAVAQVRELGGEAEEPQEIPSGSFASCHDDQGTHFYLWAPPASAG